MPPHPTEEVNGSDVTVPVKVTRRDRANFFNQAAIESVRLIAILKPMIAWPRRIEMT